MVSLRPARGINLLAKVGILLADPVLASGSEDIDVHGVLKRHSRVSHICGNQKDFARRFPAIVKAIAELPDDTVLDGEIVALDKNGRPSFDLLQGFGRQAPLTVLYAFDLLMFRGKDVRSWPLEERRGQLREIAEQLPDAIRYSETFNVPLPDLMSEVRRHHL